MEAPEELRDLARNGWEIAARDLTRPYRNTPFSNKSKQPIELIEKDYVNSYEEDISMITNGLSSLACLNGTIGLGLKTYLWII